MYLFGTDYHIHEGGLGSTHKHVDIYESGVALVNKAKAIEKKQSWKERKIIFAFNEHGVEPLVIMEDCDNGKKVHDVHYVISAPFFINVIKKGEKPNE